MSLALCVNRCEGVKLYLDLFPGTISTETARIRAADTRTEGGDHTDQRQGEAEA